MILVPLELVDLRESVVLVELVDIVGDAGDAGAGASGISEVNPICNFPRSVINEPYSNYRLDQLSIYPCTKI